MSINENVLILCIPEDVPEDGSVYDGYYNCPLCDEPFNDDTWEMYAQGGGAWGGQARYACPNDCDGVVSVNY